MTVKSYFTDNCFCCGRKNLKGLSVRIEKESDGISILRCILTNEYESFPGIVHGGIVSTLLDEAIWYAFYFCGITTVTRKLNITFKKSVPVGKPLIIKGEVVKNLKGNLWEGKATIYDDDRNIYAFAKGEFFSSDVLSNKIDILFEET